MSILIFEKGREIEERKVDSFEHIEFERLIRIKEKRKRTMGA